MKTFLLLGIRLYQRTISPDHGILKHRYPAGFCPYYPSCSQYAFTAIDKYGSIKGLVLSVNRILRCNPFTRPGVDRVP